MKKILIISSFLFVYILLLLACGNGTDNNNNLPEDPNEQSEHQTAMTDETPQDRVVDPAADVSSEEGAVNSPKTDQPDGVPANKQEEVTPVKSKGKDVKPKNTAGDQSAEAKPTASNSKDPATSKATEGPVKSTAVTETSKTGETGTVVKEERELEEPVKNEEQVTEKNNAEVATGKKEEPAVVAPPKKEEPPQTEPKQKPSSSGNWPVPASYNSKSNPVEADNSSIKIGKTLWAKHCKSCHGSDGLGDGPKAAQLDTPSGDFSTSAFQKQTDGALFYKTIEGKGDMPSYKKKIPYEEDIWHLVNFMRTLGD